MMQQRLSGDAVTFQGCSETF